MVVPRQRSARDMDVGSPRDAKDRDRNLKVAAIAETVAFYQDVLGLGLMARLGSRAAFFGAGGYHHHIGANTWESAGAAPPPADAARLRQLTIVLPGSAERNAGVRAAERIARRHARRGGRADVRRPVGQRDPARNPRLGSGGLVSSGQH
jgi:catechol 2,3-dioxygenase